MTGAAFQGNRQSNDNKFDTFTQTKQFHCVFKYFSASTYITSILNSSGWPSNLSYLMSNMFSK